MIYHFMVFVVLRKMIKYDMFYRNVVDYIYIPVHIVDQYLFDNKCPGTLV